MNNDERVNLKIEAGIYELFRNTAEKIGVSEDTLTSMAISQFLNSPLVNSYIGPNDHLRKGQDFLPTPNEVTTTEISSLDDNEASITPYFLGMHGDISWNSVFQGIRINEINFDNCEVLDFSFQDDETILWGQFSRFLPIKVSLRILARISQMKEEGEDVTIEDWFDFAFESTTAIRSYLRNMDKEHKNPRGEQIASGFPKFDEESKSLNRYVNHFCASQYNDGTIVGFPAHLGLITVQGKRGTDFMEWKVRLTQDGLDYISLSNPVIDEESPTISMSKEEAEFMMKRIKEGLPSSWGFLQFVLSSIRDGANTPTRLSNSIDSAYGSGTSRNWNEKQVPTYRTGAIGLLGDLNLISRAWNYRKVSYDLTKLGRAVIEK